jgi:ethanolamine ammonia-lyase small subunit
MWATLRQATKARIGLGRAGNAIPLAEVLKFQAAHARARDAVHAALDVETLEARLAPLSVLKVESQAPDRSTYLRRPDLGRLLAPRDEEMLKAAANEPYDILFVVADGLSSTAVENHAAALVHVCRAALPDFRIAPVVIARQARVAIADPIGEHLRARLSVVLIGERPGLTVSDSLGLYMTYGPRPGRRDLSATASPMSTPLAAKATSRRRVRCPGLCGRRSAFPCRASTSRTICRPIRSGKRLMSRQSRNHKITEGHMSSSTQTHLSKSLNAFHLWGIAVGLVISGEYFGWSYGWATAGTLGFLVTTLAVAAMYVAFIFSFTELTTAIPQAGGPFAYAKRAFGPWGGAIAGFATLIEFIFAPPAISLAIGAYLGVQFPRSIPRMRR